MKICSVPEKKPLRGSSENATTIGVFYIILLNKKKKEWLMFTVLRS